MTEGHNDNFKKMMVELKEIRNNVEAGQNIDNFMKDSIPELINFSAEIREDDHELESNQASKVIER